MKTMDYGDPTCREIDGMHVSVTRWCVKLSIVQSFNRSIVQSFNRSIVQSFNRSIVQSFVPIVGTRRRSTPYIQYSVVVLEITDGWDGVFGAQPCATLVILLL